MSMTDTNEALSDCEHYVLTIAWLEPIYSVAKLEARCVSFEERPRACSSHDCAMAIGSCLDRHLLEVVTEDLLLAARSRDREQPSLCTQTQMTFPGAVVLSPRGTQLYYSHGEKMRGADDALRSMGGTNVHADRHEVEIISGDENDCRRTTADVIRNVELYVGGENVRVIGVEQPHRIGRWLTHWYLYLDKGYRAVVRYSSSP